MRKKTVFFVFFQNFRILSKIFSDFRPKNFKKLKKKLTSARPDEHFVTLIFFKNFKPFWIFCRNIWHGSQNSIYVSRVKIAEKKFFFVFFPEFFRFLSKNFSDFWPKNFKHFSKLPSTCPEEQFVAWIFILSFETFRIFCRNIWQGSQNSIHVSRVKIAEETVFYCFLSRIFSNFEQKFFRLLAKKLQKVFKSTFYVSRGTVCGLNFFFSKFWIVLDFLQKPSAWFSKFYPRVQSKNCGKNRFLLFYFPNFFRILSKIFSDFWPKNFKNLWKLTSPCPQEQLVALNFFKSFEPFWIVCRNLWHGSQNSIYVSRWKLAEEIFFFLPFWIFFGFWTKNFSDFWPKNFKNL